ncbi:MAG: alpha/beta hydrolase [Candidatus Cardinium sp.]|nr:alpha/beta hydrolase [Candidatus Cardinium sp.]
MGYIKKIVLYCLQLVIIIIIIQAAACRRSDSGYAEVASKTKSAKQLVVCLHRAGSNGDELINSSILPLHHNLPDCHFMAPHGTEFFIGCRHCFPSPNPREWFDSMPLRKESYSEIEDQDRTIAIVQPLLAKNVPLLINTIKQKQRALQLTNKDTIIVGFFEGATMGIYLTLMQEEPFLATIALPPSILIPPSSCKNTQTPISLIYEKDDTIKDDSILEKRTDTAIAYFKKCNVPCNRYILPSKRDRRSNDEQQKMIIDCIRKASKA